MQKYLILALSALSFSITSNADEGMWLLNHFPTAKVEKKYGFKASESWLKHVQLSSARLARGCSGSFVSDQGLILTNHHCARHCIQQISRSGKDFIADGFYAKSAGDEVKCPDMEINQLTNISDVTKTVNQKTKGLTGQKYSDTMKATTAQLEKDCSHGSDDLRCDVVTLYHGGAYHLYEYRRFQDVRLVFAPEMSMAFFGGDPDNFMYPRYDLDMSIVRVYDHDAPLKTENYFKWSKTPAKEGDLTFVTGHPGNTERGLTISELETIRDLSGIHRLTTLSELRGFLAEYQNRGKEEKRISGDLFFGVENSLKAYKGRMSALMDKKFFAQKQKEEQQLISAVRANPTWNKDLGSAWSEVEKAQNKYREIFLPLTWLEKNRDFSSELFGIARALIRAAKELPKPNGERLKEFTDSKLPELKQGLFSEAPIYKDFEAVILGYHLTKLREHLTADHPIIKKIFATESPTQLAERIVKDSKLNDVGLRHKLFDGGWDAISKSKDPMIQFALSIDEEARAIRKVYEDQIESVMKKSGEKVAKAQFLVHGSDTYPDATFTLRISYGKIEGYMENGKKIVPVTTIGGAYDRHTGYDPFELPESWMKAKKNMDLSTPLNFCSSNDIIGGNSGSPVINRNAEIVGLIFDGNIQGLGGDFGYDGSVNRAVAVHSSGIVEALKKVYGADRIAQELLK